jgi:hypothetical protein
MWSTPCSSRQGAAHPPRCTLNDPCRPHGVGDVGRWQAADCRLRHDIPEAKIRERWVQAPLNLITLMPHWRELERYDDSVEAAARRSVEDPVLVLRVWSGWQVYPLALPAWQRRPGWAEPLVKAARGFERR